MSRSLRRLWFGLYALCGLLGVNQAWADTVVVAKRIDFYGVSLQDVTVQLAPGADADTLKISVHAGRADFPALGWRRVGVAVQGNLQRDLQLRWLFDGSVQISGAPGNALGNGLLKLVLDHSANTLETLAIQGAAHVGTALPLDQPSHLQVNLRNVPADWLQGLLAMTWAGHITGGKLDADLALDLHEDGFQSSGDFTGADLRYTTPAGNVGADGLSTHARFALDATHSPAQLSLNGSLHGGALQFGPAWARLPDHDVALDLSGTVRRGGAEISRVHMDDADALQWDGSLSIDAKGMLQKFKLDRFQARFPAAYDRYGQPWLDDALGSSIRFSGQLDGHADYAVDGWRSFALHSDGLNITQSIGLFQATGLRGTLDWSEQGDRPPTNLSWNALTLRKFTVGAVPSHWRSHNGTLALQSPLAAPFFNGQIQLTALEWRPNAAKPQRLNLAASAAGIDMATLNPWLGWTPIAGTLGGTIASISWADDRYELQGGFTINAFDGTAALTHLAVSKPFGDSPLITTDMSLRQLDLAPLAETFNFGNMTGRLNGSIDGLQLAGGSPVAFQASLRAEKGGKISLRAANNLSIVTGGTAAGGFQGAVMKLFKLLSYKRMGIDSSLQNGVCTFGGLDGSASGYTIVEGDGLPYMHVVGAQTHIDWPTFLRRLKSVTQGPVAGR